MKTIILITLLLTIPAMADVAQGTLHWSDAYAVSEELAGMGVDCSVKIIDEDEFGIDGAGIAYLVAFPGRYFNYSSMRYARLDDEDTFRIVAAIGVVARVSRTTNWNSHFVLIAFEDCMVVLLASDARIIESLAQQDRPWTESLFENSFIIQY